MNNENIADNLEISNIMIHNNDNVNNNNNDNNNNNNNRDQIYPMAYEEKKETWDIEDLNRFIDESFINLEDIKKTINVLSNNFILFIIKEIYRIIYFLKFKNEIFIDFNLQNILFYKNHFDIRLKNYKKKINKNDYLGNRQEIITNFNRFYNLNIDINTIHSFEDLKHLQNYSLGINLKRLNDNYMNNAGLNLFINNLTRMNNNNLATNFDENFLLQINNEYDFDKIIRINQFVYERRERNGFSRYLNKLNHPIVFTIKQINNIKTKKYLEQLKKKKKFSYKF
jgi:hypothetical protein